jgi:MFS family permease
VAISAVFSNRLVDRVGPGPIIAVTLTTMAVGYLLFLRIDTAPSYVAMILPAVVLIAIGWIGFPAVNILATTGIDDDEQGLAAGVLQTAMQVGAAIVLAITSALIASTSAGAGPQAVLDGYRPGLVFAFVVAAVGAVVTVAGLALSRRTAGAAVLPVDLVEEEYAA